MTDNNNTPAARTPVHHTSSNQTGVVQGGDDEDRTGLEWLVSFGCSMVPITAFGYIHSRGWTGHVVQAVVKSPVGVYGLLALPFFTLAMEKCIYDTTQAAQGIDPNVRPADRGGFPSGGAALPSLSLVPVRNIFHLRPPVTTTTTLSSRATSTASS